MVGFLIKRRSFFVEGGLVKKLLYNENCPSSKEDILRSLRLLTPALT